MDEHRLTLARPPEARAETVEDLVLAARRGRLRIPRFQRGLKWESSDVCAFFDSLHRGLPVGSLLVWKRPAPAAELRLGPLVVAGEQMSDAWFVVDGQQRLTSLVAALARDWPPPPEDSDPFRVLFDPVRHQFEPLPRRGEPPTAWVPLPFLLDSATLAERLLTWSHFGDIELRRRVFEASKRIREYRIPLYVVETEDEAVLREIFYRINETGKKLAWDDVHDALFGGKGPEPSTTQQLADALAKLGMGRPTPDQLVPCLVAFRGGDVTHIDPHDPKLEGAAAESLPALRQTLVFLRNHAAIPHLRLLPRAWLIEPLVRFFALHGTPSARSRELLTRWVWRAMLDQASDERTLRRRAVSVIGDDEEESVQALLRLVPRDARPLTLPERFDARAADTRVALLAMAFLKPLDLVRGAPIDVRALLAEHDVASFPKVLDADQSQVYAGPENRLIHAPIRDLIEHLHVRVSERTVPHRSILASHVITPPAAQALERGDDARFLELRRTALEQALTRLATKLCGWDRGDRDRPSLRRVRGGEAEL